MEISTGMIMKIIVVEHTARIEHERKSPMSSELNLSVLEQTYRLSIAGEVTAPLVFAADGLLRKETVKPFLRQVGEQIGSPTAVVTASIFFKRFLTVICGGLYAMSVHSAGLDLSLGNVLLTAEKNWALPRFVLRDGSVSTPGGPGRDVWREQVLRRFFAETVHPLIATLSAVTGIHANVLWAHTAYIVHYYYEDWQQRDELSALRGQLAADFRFLCREAGPDLFGLTTGNPLDTSFTVVSHPKQPDRPIRIRRQCCFQYRLAGGRCCYTCPLLNEEKRTEQILALGH
jgi:ferric iron reductase protein FhuF